MQFYSHVSVVDKRPASRSFQCVVEEILQSPVARAASVSPARAAQARSRSVQTHPAAGAPARALSAPDQQRAVPARLRAAGIHSHKTHLRLFLLLRRRAREVSVGRFPRHCQSLREPRCQAGKRASPEWVCVQRLSPTGKIQRSEAAVISCSPVRVLSCV